MLPFLCAGQEYVDLFKIGYGETINTGFKDIPGRTTITSVKSGFTLPVPLNENHVLIIGADFTYNNLQLYPEAEYTSLFNSMLTLGMNSGWSEKWSTTLILLPKLASDYKHLSHEDFFMGVLAIAKFKSNKDFFYRFGFYASQEAFGIFTTPILGGYYLSPNKKFEIDISFPISANINYKLGGATIGMDYFGISRSFNVHPENVPPLYVDLSSTEIATYLQVNFINKSVLLRTKVGYSSNDYKLFSEDDKIDLALSAFRFGDDRTQLNPSLNGSAFVRLEMIYRYDLTSKQPVPNK